MLVLQEFLPCRTPDTNPYGLRFGIHHLNFYRHGHPYCFFVFLNIFVSIALAIWQ